MSRFRPLAVVLALCTAVAAGVAHRAAAASTVVTPHLQQAGDVAHAARVPPNVIKIQKTGTRVRRNAPAQRPRVRRNRQRVLKVERPRTPRVQRRVAPNKPKTRKLARPDKPRVRRDVRPGKRRLRRLAMPHKAHKPHTRPGKRHSKKHRRRKRKVFIYGGFAPYYRYYPSYPSYTYYEPRGYEGRCAYWEERCVAEWGYQNPDYYGCMQYHRCD